MRKVTLLIAAFLLVLNFQVDAGVFSADKNIASVKGNPGDFSGRYTFSSYLPDLSIEEIQSPEGITYLQYFIPGSHFLREPGKPNLPGQSFRIEIPSAAKNVQVRVLDSDTSEETIAYHIYPAEQPVHKKDPVTDFEYVDEEFYLDEGFYLYRDQFYPAEPVKISELGNIRGFRYAVVDVYYLQYRPADKTLKTNSELSIELTWDLYGEEDSQKITETFEHIIDQMNVLNRTSGTAESGQMARAGTAEVSYPADLSDASNKADYLIITADQFYGSEKLNEHAIHRRDFNDFNVAVVRTSDIYAAVGDTIPDDSELVDSDEDHLDLEIKTFIKYVYEEWDNRENSLEYVLLVGDAYPETEEFFLPGHIFPPPEVILSDYWYSCINDDSGNGLIDEDDSVGDFFLGRFSVQTNDQLAAVVDKTITYELDPPEYPAEEWGGKALLTSGFLIKENYMPFIKNRYINPNRMEATEVYADLYDEDCVGDCYDYYLQALNDMKTALNNGHSLFMHNGHGQVDGWAIGWEFGYPFPPMFYSDDVSALVNGDMLPVVVSAACLTGKLDDATESLAEAFVNEPGNGAIAFIGASRESHNAIDQSLLNGISMAIFAEGNDTIGSVILEGKTGIHANYITPASNLYNLFGDPALDISQTITESHKPDLTGSFILGIEDSNAVFHITVRNHGLTGAENISVELFLGHPSDGGVLIEDAAHDINLGSESQASYSVVLPVEAEWFGRNIYLILDRLDDIAEINEYDNLSYPIEFLDGNGNPQFILLGEGERRDIHNNKIVWYVSEDNMDTVMLYDMGEDGVFGTSDDNGSYEISEHESCNEVAVYDNKIVWSVNVDGIYLYDLGSDGIFDTADDIKTVKVSPEGSLPYNPDIYGNKIVWEKSGIFLYDLGIDGIFGTADDIETVWVNPGSDGDRPMIYENKILWTQPGEIYLYDLGPDGIFGTPDDIAPTQISSDDVSAYKPDMYGNKIVWREARNPSDCYVVLYDIGEDGIFGTGDDSGEVEIASIDCNSGIFIYDNIIVWTQHNEVIHIYDLGPDGRFNTEDDIGESQINNITDYLYRGLAVYGNNIVYKPEDVQTFVAVSYYCPADLALEGERNMCHNSSFEDDNFQIENFIDPENPHYFTGEADMWAVFPFLGYQNDNSYVERVNDPAGSHNGSGPHYMKVVDTKGWQNGGNLPETCPRCGDAATMTYVIRAIPGETYTCTAHAKPISRIPYEGSETGWTGAEYFNDGRQDIRMRFFNEELEWIETPEEQVSFEKCSEVGFCTTADGPDNIWQRVSVTREAPEVEGLTYVQCSVISDVPDIGETHWDAVQIKILPMGYEYAGQYSCCGDDDKEFYICGGSGCFCCNSNSDTISGSGECEPTEFSVPTKFPDINSAIYHAKDGDVISVHPGVYEENLQFTGKSVEIRSISGSEHAIIDAGNSGSAVTVEQDSDVTLRGFTFKNGNAEEGGGIKCSDSAISIINGSIINNSAHFTGEGGGLYFSNCNADLTNVVIAKNRIIESGGLGAGIYMEGSDATCTNCVVADNDAGAMVGHGGGIYMKDDSHLTMMNSILWGNIDGDPAGINGGSDIYVYNISQSNRYEGNYIQDYVDMDYSDIQGDWPESAGIDNMSVDPSFADPGNGDYHLRYSGGFSECADAGNPAIEYDDLDSTRNDMGAYGGPLAEGFSPPDDPPDYICFLAGTSILMEDGSLKNIEDIKEGDWVLSANDEGEFVTGKVSKAFVYPEKKGYLIVETADGKPIRVTAEHPVYSDGEYIPIGELTIDSPMTLIKDGQLVEASIVSMRKVSSAQTVYNFEVEDTHTYFAEGYLVHNKESVKGKLRD
ncbi:C25 family cysteine peptidase [Candidatus Omnitrophota bacterium]